MDNSIVIPEGTPLSLEPIEPAPPVPVMSNQDKIKKYNKEVVEIFKRYFRRVISGDSVRFSSYTNTCFWNCEVQYPPSKLRSRISLSSDLYGNSRSFGTRFSFSIPINLFEYYCGGYDTDSGNLVLDFSFAHINVGEENLYNLDRYIAHNLQELPKLMEKIEIIKPLTRNNLVYLNLGGNLYNINNPEISEVKPEQEALNLYRSVYEQKLNELKSENRRLEQEKQNAERNGTERLKSLFTNFIPVASIPKAERVNKSDYGTIRVYFKHELIVKDIINARYRFALKEPIKHKNMLLCIEYMPGSACKVRCPRCYFADDETYTAKKYFHSLDTYKLCFGNTENRYVYDTPYNNADELIGYIRNKIVNFETVNTNSMLSHLEDRKFEKIFAKAMKVRGMCDEELDSDQIKACEEELGCKITDIQEANNVWKQPQ